MHCADAPSVYVVPMGGVQRLPGRDLDIRMFPEPSVHFQILRSGGVGVSPDEIEGATAEDGAMVSQSHRMIDMQSLAVDEPVLAWVVIVSIPDSLDTERNPPRKRDVIVVPKGDEVPSSKAHRGIQFLPEGMEPPVHVDHEHIGRLEGQKLAGAVAQYDQLLSRIVLDQERLERFLHQPFMGRRPVVRQADATHQWDLAHSPIAVTGRAQLTSDWGGPVATIRALHFRGSPRACFAQGAETGGFRSVPRQVGCPGSPRGARSGNFEACLPRGEGTARQPAFRTCASVGTRADRASFGRLGGTSHGCTLLRPRIPETAG